MIYIKRKILEFNSLVLLEFEKHNKYKLKKKLKSNKKGLKKKLGRPNRLLIKRIKKRKR